MSKRVTIVIPDAAYALVQQLATTANMDAAAFIGAKLRDMAASAMVGAALAQIKQQSAALPAPTVAIEDVKEQP
jgi:hypothetical protein